MVQNNIRIMFCDSDSMSYRITHLFAVFVKL